MAFVQVAATADVSEGSTVGLILDGREVVVVRSGGVLFALSNRCTHAGSRLDGGRVREGWIACPLHGARFRLASGECVNARLGYRSLSTYPVREVDGLIEIDLPA